MPYAAAMNDISFLARDSESIGRGQLSKAMAWEGSSELAGMLSQTKRSFIGGMGMWVSQNCFTLKRRDTNFYFSVKRDIQYLGKSIYRIVFGFFKFT
jgi:hypothetical protein